MSEAGKVAIVGCGLVGRSWAMLFAAASYKVSLYDSVPEQIEFALKEIEKTLTAFETAGLLRGNLSSKAQLAAISASPDLASCVHGAKYVQESVFESLDVKKDVLTQIDQYIDEGTVMASSTSNIMPTKLSEHLKHRENFIISHPVNPPYFVPLVEVVLAPWTSPQILARTKAILESIGQDPITLHKEIPGFVCNRLQYALLNECWSLVQSGVISVEDVDKVMSEGLGMRYAFVGPLQVAHLNAEGMANYVGRYGKDIYNVASDFGPIPRWGGEAAVEIDRQLRELIPLDKLVERRRWRDECLAQLLIVKNKMNASK